jgi:hypothetical protein
MLREKWTNKDGVSAELVVWGDGLCRVDPDLMRQWLRERGYERTGQATTDGPVTGAVIR